MMVNLHQLYFSSHHVKMDWVYQRYDLYIALWYHFKEASVVNNLLRSKCPRTTRTRSAIDEIRYEIQNLCHEKRRFQIETHWRMSWSLDLIVEPPVNVQQKLWMKSEEFHHYGYFRGTATGTYCLFIRENNSYLRWYHFLI